MDDVEAVMPKIADGMKPAIPAPFLFGDGYSGLLALLYNLRNANTDKVANG